LEDAATASPASASLGNATASPAASTPASAEALLAMIEGEKGEADG